MKKLNLLISSFCLLFFVSCTKDNDDLAKFKISTKADFAKFLATKPFDLIDSTSYNFGKDDIMFNLFEETGKYSWGGYEWHQENIFPLWKKYKQANQLISEQDLVKTHFKAFLATKPIPGIDATSYNNGEDQLYIGLFEETGVNSWLGHEWHRDNLLALWKKYKNEHGLKTNRMPTKADFALFLATKPFTDIDSSSYNYGQDSEWFMLFQQTDPNQWIGKEWHRDNVLPKWLEYKSKNTIK